MPDGTEPVEDTELLYRRVSKVYYESGLSPEAFRPTDQDVDGISLSREKYHSLEEAARGRPGKTYYVAVFRAGDLREAGIEIAPDPQPDITGHVLLTNMDYENRKSKEGLERKMAMKRRYLRLEGPFSTPDGQG